MNAQNEHIALYPGTFDGVTYGHLDIIRRGAKAFDRLVVAVAVNTSKQPLFSIEERVEILREETAGIPNMEITSFDGLTMKFAEQIQADCVIRGIRVVSDFEYEFQMALMNRALNARIETLFMPPAAEHLFISSSLIKDVLTLGGDVSQFVPPSTERHLRRKLNRPAGG